MIQRQPVAVFAAQWTFDAAESIDLPGESPMQVTNTREFSGHYGSSPTPDVVVGGPGDHRPGLDEARRRRRPWNRPTAWSNTFGSSTPVMARRYRLLPQTSACEAQALAFVVAFRNAIATADTAAMVDRLDQSIVVAHGRPKLQRLLETHFPNRNVVELGVLEWHTTAARDDDRVVVQTSAQVPVAGRPGSQRQLHTPVVVQDKAGTLTIVKVGTDVEPGERDLGVLEISPARLVSEPVPPL